LMMTIWAEAAKQAEAEVARCEARIAAPLRRAWHPQAVRSRPECLGWRHRGYGNLLDSRRAELLGVAKARIAAEKKAAVDIQMQSAAAQTLLAAAGLPALSFEEIAVQLTRHAEQLITSGALRQRRYRERLSWSASDPKRTLLIRLL
jgi:hypothetical protein